ncbi:MAG: isoprenylcysteine carboxylmethyltransferase family protein [Chloroflexi bacterium CFX6]|nr:isoprenylcysteine carboxylmethyltransferase family protein [Chloroflexi bacterium CFX6]
MPAFPAVALLFDESYGMFGPMSSPPPAPSDTQRRDVVIRMAQVIGSIVVMGVLLFGIAGTYRWPEAWLLLGLFAGITLVAGIAFAPRHLAVVAARSRMHVDEAPRWDRVIAALWGVLALITPAVAALEHRLRGAEPWSPALPVTGAVMLIAAYALTAWAMAANPFFETLVRIQHERGHVTVTGGPYAYVRHPGYVGTAATVLAMVLILRSPWALVPAVLGVAALIARTALEDRFLREQLTGYAEYARRVRYRLLPGVW